MSWSGSPRRVGMSVASPLALLPWNGPWTIYVPGWWHWNEREEEVGEVVEEEEEVVDVEISAAAMEARARMAWRS